MQEDFVKEKIIIEKNEKEKEKEIITNILKAKRELNIANKNFEYAEDEMIDYYSYQIKAIQAKLGYLLRRAKKDNLQLDMINEMNFRLYNENNEAV